MISLGSKVRDVYTGFTGIVVSRADYMYGCSRIEVNPMKIGKDGKTRDSEWFEEQRLEVLSVNPPKKASQVRGETGFTGKTG